MLFDMLCVFCAWPHGTGMTVIPKCFGIIAPAASVVKQPSFLNLLLSVLL